MELEEIRADRKRNQKQRLKFVSWYARWVKCTPNSVWSKQQKELIDSVLKSSNKAAIDGVIVRGKAGK